MPALTPQQSDWESNGYVVATTRVFILAGVVQLGRSLYHLISRYSGVVAETAPTTGASRGRIDVDLATIASDTLSIASMDQDVDINVSGDLELGIQQPRRSYQSHRYPYGPRTHRQEQPQIPQASTNFENPTATVVQCSEPASVGTNSTQSTDMSGGF